MDDAVFLKRYYLESRYPDDLPQDVRPEEVAAALTATSHLRDFVLGKGTDTLTQKKTTGVTSAGGRGAP